MPRKKRLFFLNYVMDQIHLSTMWSFYINYLLLHSQNIIIKQISQVPVTFSIHKDSLRKFPGDPAVRTRVWSLVAELRSCHDTWCGYKNFFFFLIKRFIHTQVENGQKKWIFNFVSKNFIILGQISLQETQSRTIKVWSLF